jgi:predicted DCC family thiol-disulfide oxidoreductase YuxK
MRLTQREPYSFRRDSAVPPFDDRGPIVFMDGECLLCSRVAKVIAKLDRAEEFRICPIQSALGRGILQHYGLKADDPESWLFLCDGRAYSSLDAVIRAGARLGGKGRLLQGLRMLPRPVQDWIYRRIARNRYWLFGQADLCALPDPALKRRLML